MNKVKRLAIAGAASAILLGGMAVTALADTPTTIQIAVPINVTLTKDVHQIHFIGKPTSISTVNCAPGTARPHTAVAVDPGGGDASQISGVLAFHDHDIPNGARYKITSDGVACTPELKLYTATLN